MSVFFYFKSNRPRTNRTLRLPLTAAALMLVMAACGDRPPSGSTTAAETDSARRYNVVWILLDASRAENFSANGYHRKTTPNMDAVAKRGATFLSHYAQTNNTLRSVPSYMTGRYFAVSCLTPRGRVPYVRRRPEGEVLFPRIMRENGYHTAMFSAHLSFVHTGSELWRSFDESLAVSKGGSPGPLPAFSDINREVLPWLDHHASEPFFLYIHSVDTHFPHVLEPPYDRWIDTGFDRSHLHTGLSGQTIERKDGKPYSHADKAYMRALYDGSLAYTDAYVGALLDRLESLGVLDETIVVISSDHGEALGEDGRTMEHSRAGISDAVLRVPFIIAGPGIPRRGGIKNLTANVDIVPTLVEVLGLDTTAEMHGRSLLPLLERREREPHPEGVLAWHTGAQPSHPILAAYHDAPAMVWITETAKYEIDPTVGQSFLWAMPDDLRDRRELLQRGWKKDRELADRLDRRIREYALPLREAYLALPVREIDLEAPALAQLAQPRDAFVWFGELDRPELRRDGKWHVSNLFLSSSGAAEDVPALTVRLPVPNGRYAVEVSLLHDAETESRPASAVRIRIQDETAFQTIDTRKLDLKNTAIATAPLGEVDVTDGSFVAVINDAPGGAWALIRRIRLRDPDAPDRVTGADSDMESWREIEEALEAMGYN